MNSPPFIKPCHLSDFTWFLTVKKNAKYFEIKPDVQPFITELTQGLVNRVIAIRYDFISYPEIDSAELNFYRSLQISDPRHSEFQDTYLKIPDPRCFEF